MESAPYGIKPETMDTYVKSCGKVFSLNNFNRASLDPIFLFATKENRLASHPVPDPRDNYVRPLVHGFFTVPCI